MGEKTQSDQDQITQQHDRWFDNQKLFFAVATDFSHNQIKLDSICLFFGEEMFQWPLPKNNFPWKILGVTWFKKTNVAIMPPKKIEYNWCNKWEVIFRHTFCSFEFCLYLELWSGNFAVNYVGRLTKTVIAQVSKSSSGDLETSGTNLKSGHKIGGKPNAISPRLTGSFSIRGPLIQLGWPSLILDSYKTNKIETFKSKKDTRGHSFT